MKRSAFFIEHLFRIWSTATTSLQPYYVSQYISLRMQSDFLHQCISSCFVPQNIRVALLPRHRRLNQHTAFFDSQMCITERTLKLHLRMSRNWTQHKHYFNQFWVTSCTKTFILEIWIFSSTFLSFYFFIHTSFVAKNYCNGLKFAGMYQLPLKWCQEHKKNTFWEFSSCPLYLWIFPKNICWLCRKTKGDLIKSQLSNTLTYIIWLCFLFRYSFLTNSQEKFKLIKIIAWIPWIRAFNFKSN